MACEVSLAPPSDALEVPERQFTLSEARLEERRDGHVQWSGTAAWATGDRRVMQAQQIALRRTPKDPSQQPFEVQAAQGSLRLWADCASFEAAVVQHAAGTLHTPHADYDGAAGRLDGAAPVQIATPHGQAQGQRGTLFVDEGRLELEGPVQGHLLPH